MVRAHLAALGGTSSRPVPRPFGPSAALLDRAGTRRSRRLRSGRENGGHEGAPTRVGAGRTPRRRPMSTRKLIIAAVLTGAAILAAGITQIVLGRAGH